MEELFTILSKGIASNDYVAVTSVFMDHGDTTGGGRHHSWLTVGQGEQRSVAAHFVHAAVTSPTFLPRAFDNADVQDVMVTALSHLPATVEQAADNTLRQQLFDYMVAQDDPDYATAARILGAMRMETEPTVAAQAGGGGGGNGNGNNNGNNNNVYYMSPAARTDVYVKIAECFLAEDEIAESDAAVQKAGQVVENIQDREQHQALILRYKSTYARVLDANRKFLQAAQRYHDLSQSSTDLIDADDLLHLLGRAATCAVLAPSGPQRQRVLGHIYKDARLRQLDGLDDFQTHATILKKMVTHQVLRPDELTKFEATLAEHQKAIMGDGLTIMERGVVEHNMIAVSNLYRSIYVTELARILGVDARKAEKIASSMILEGSLHGSIDQVEGLLEFEAEESPEQTWDRSITSFCIELNNVTDRVKASAQ
jgi:COP9 signalosome complex subunit 4